MLNMNEKKTPQYKKHASSHLLLMHINDLYKIHVWKSCIQKCSENEARVSKQHERQKKRAKSFLKLTTYNSISQYMNSKHVL